MCTPDLGAALFIGVYLTGAEVWRKTLVQQYPTTCWVVPLFFTILINKESAKTPVNHLQLSRYNPLSQYHQSPYAILLGGTFLKNSTLTDYQNAPFPYFLVFCPLKLKRPEIPPVGSKSPTHPLRY